jgi:CRISPR/Cas system endoribonuclease Cas6 (RAMP superfamily)
MSDYDLKVLTDHLHHLADRQQAAASRIRMADEKVSGLSSSVLSTHGLACWATISALRAAEAARHTASVNNYKASMDLKDRLNWAAENYNNADWVSGKDIGQCGL